MKCLTIIIPFLNENTEIENTVISIQETATGNPEILLINDASDDGYDYEALAKKYKCRYLAHEQRMGVAASRDEGVELTETPYFLLLDGHMRFYDKGWDTKLVDLLEQYPRTLFCGQTKVLHKKKGEIVEKDITHYGAYISELDLRAVWNNHDTSPHSNLMEIPCVLGAAYSMSKTYWKYLHGLHGLKYYGIDEQLISLKVWKEGGRCVLIKDWIVGHIYREEFPYQNLDPERLYNMLYVVELILSYPIKHDVFLNLRTYWQDFDRGLKLLQEEYKMVKKEKIYLASILKEDFDEFKAFNHTFKELNGKVKNESLVISQL